MKENSGRAAIVVPTGFLTAGTGIPKIIREHIVKEKMLRGVISMPSNILLRQEQMYPLYFWIIQRNMTKQYLWMPQNLELR